MKWDTWRTVRLGTSILTPDDYRKAVKETGMKIGVWAEVILTKSVFSKIETEVELVKVSLKDLKLKKATYNEVRDRIADFGLKLCPEEVGPQLRLQYPEQPKGLIHVGMEGIIDWDEKESRGSYTYYLEHDDTGKWLRAMGDSTDLLTTNEELLFLR